MLVDNNTLLLPILFWGPRAKLDELQAGWLWKSEVQFLHFLTCPLPQEGVLKLHLLAHWLLGVLATAGRGNGAASP